MRILVTGGAGFVGSHLVDRLMSEDHEIICVDSFYSGKRENVAHHFGNKRFNLIRQDIRRPLKLSGRLDRIYNLACPASPQQYQFDPVLTLETSVLGVQNMLSLARATGARLLHTSTSEVYGDPLEHPQKETYWGNVDPLGKRACYDEGKRAAETLCKDYHEQYGIDARLVRIFNTYGPRMMFNDGRVLSNFILQSLLNEDITVFGDGSQTRSFMYIDDLIEGLVRRMEVASADWRPVNLGNPDERAIGDLAHLVKRETASESAVVFISEKDNPSRIGDPKQRCPDISRAKELLDWQPTVSFADGLQKTIADFKKRLAHRPHIIVFGGLDVDLKPAIATAWRQIAARLPGWEFDFITTDTSGLSDAGTKLVHRHRVGKLGTLFSLWKAARKASELHKQFNYQSAWVITSGHNAWSAALFSWFTHGKVPLLLSVFDPAITPAKLRRGVVLAPLYRLLFRHAHEWQIVGPVSAQEQLWLESERKVQVVPAVDNWEFVAKKTKERFQELEILASRI